jgi:hypothetical protein
MNKRNLGRQREDRILEAEEILREIQNQPRTIVCEFKTPVRKFGKFVKTETSLNRVRLSWTHNAEAMASVLSSFDVSFCTLSLCCFLHK